jgi:hypothetical protein
MYKLCKSPFTQEIAGVIRTIDNAVIPFDPDNSDYQAYLKFLAEGGQPLPADSE